MTCKKAKRAKTNGKSFSTSDWRGGRLSRFWSDIELVSLPANLSSTKELFSPRQAGGLSAQQPPLTDQTRPVKGEVNFGNCWRRTTCAGKSKRSSQWQRVPQGPQRCLHYISRVYWGISKTQRPLKQGLNDPGSILSDYSWLAPLLKRAAAPPPSWAPAGETRPWLQWKPHRPASSMNAAVIEFNSWIKSCWTVLELTAVQCLIWDSWVLSTFWPWQRKCTKGLSTQRYQHHQLGN